VRVLLIYYEPQPSGQTAHVLSLVRGLDPARFRLTVALPERLWAQLTSCLTGCAAAERVSESGLPHPDRPPAARFSSFSRALEQAGAQVLPLALRKALWSPRAVVALMRLIRRSGIDLVHVHSQEAGLLARLVACLAGAPAVIYTPQTIDIRRRGWHWLYRWIERALAHVTDVIISVAEADRERLIRWGIPAHKVVTIPNGIDLSPFGQVADRAALFRELGLAPLPSPSGGAAGGEGGLVMQVGRLSAQKDPLAFVDGAALVLRECHEARFVWIGEGPLRTVTEERIRAHGLEGRVFLPGWRDNASRFMPAADVVSLTSRWEGTPYALLEAMAWSRPVVATAVNGCPEIVVDGESGFLVPPGDPSAWAGRVVALLRDPTRAAAMGAEGRRRVEEKFGLPQMIAQIESLYARTAPSR